MSELKLLKSKIDICPDSEAHLPCLLWRCGPAVVGGRAGEDCIFQITSHCENAVNLWLQIFSEMTLEPPGAGAGPRAAEHFTDSSLVVQTRVGDTAHFHCQPDTGNKGENKVRNF